MINVGKLHKQIEAAGIEISGCNANGIVWDADGNEIQSRADVEAIIAAHNPTIYIITPDDNHTVINNPVDITVIGAANEAVTLYAYPVTDVPDVSHELDVALDADGRGVVPFVADSAGQWAIRGKAGELANIVSIILVVA